LRLDLPGILNDHLSTSKAVSSGKLRDLGEFELLVPGIGSDKISDLAINVIRGELTAYTKEQCDLYGIPTEFVTAGGLCLSGHPKTGQRWSGQNRPTGRGRGLSCFTLQLPVQASRF
jgi:hypothetical protein